MDKSTTCPVCTLYLREGITLEEHLKTHPKEQVISALLKAVSTTKESPTALQTTSQLSVNTQQLPKLYPISQRPIQHLIQPQTQMTTAVTYQQYMTSNGTSIVPQYIQVPTIVTPNHNLPMQSLQYIPSNYQYNTLYNPYIPQPYTMPVLNNSYPTQVSVISTPPLAKPQPSKTTATSTNTDIEFVEEQQEVQYQDRDDVYISKHSVITSMKQTAEVDTTKIEDPDWEKTDLMSPIITDPLSVGNYYPQMEEDHEDHVTNDDELLTESVILGGAVLYKSNNVDIDTVDCSKRSITIKRNQFNNRNYDKEEDPSVLFIVEDQREEADVFVPEDNKEEQVEKVEDVLDDENVAEMSITIPPEMIDSQNEVLNDDFYFVRTDQNEVLPAKDECQPLEDGASSGYNESVMFTDLQPAKNLSLLHDFRYHYNDHNYIEVESLRILFANEDGQQSQSCLNIQADETMPAKGELSEQESLGADNSNWALAYQNEIADTKPTSSLNIIANKRSFKCSSCDLKFSCPKERRVHKNTVHSTNDGDAKKKSFSCFACGKLFASLKLRRQHMVSEGHLLYQHSSTLANNVEEAPQTTPILQPDRITKKNKKDVTVDTVKQENFDIKQEVEEVRELICAKCNITQPSFKHLLEHVKLKHDEPKYQCTTCNTNFALEKDYNEHLKIHPLSCDKCNKVFYKKQNLNLHLRRHLDEKPFKCTLCSKSFVTRQKLEEHNNGHLGNKPLKCPSCDYRSSRYSNLVQHKKLHHLRQKKKIKDFVCRCGEVFHSRRKLEWHKEVHDAKPKTCPHCTQKFVHGSSLTRHIRRSHAPAYLPDEQRKVENVHCPICNKVYIQTSLLVHMRVHNGSKPFPCKICNKRFTTKWNLQLHSWTHQSRSNMPYKCIQCKSAFFRHSDYVIHLNAHKNFKPFSCNICGQKFIRKYNCLRHQLEHKSDKRFRCTVADCGKSFHRSYYLKDHLKVHTGVRPYSCHVCGKASSTKSNHNKHVKIHDTREPVNTEN